MKLIVEVTSYSFVCQIYIYVKAKELIRIKSRLRCSGYFTTLTVSSSSMRKTLFDYVTCIGLSLSVMIVKAFIARLHLVIGNNH